MLDPNPNIFDYCTSIISLRVSNVTRDLRRSDTLTCSKAGHRTIRIKWHGEQGGKLMNQFSKNNSPTHAHHVTLCYNIPNATNIIKDPDDMAHAAQT